jgi:hypothetical protein
MVIGSDPMNLEALEHKDGVAKSFDFLPEDSPQAKMAKDKIEQLRQQLLDLSSRNRFLNFRHAARGGRFVRIVDESLADMFSHVASGKQFELVSVPAPEAAPDDENTPEFRAALDEALLTDRVYRRKVTALEETAGDILEASLHHAERELRDRLRRKLKMPTRHQAMPTAEEQARSFGMNPHYDVQGRNYRRGRDQNKFQTLLWEDELDRKLRGVEKQDRESRQEYGVHTLHLILGFLEWRPLASHGESEEILFSPLILQPLSVEKTKRRRRGEALAGQQSGDASPRENKERYIFRANELDEPNFNLVDLREIPIFALPT